MASQEVLSALESLHREIEKLEPAIKHVETAQQVTQTVKAIPQKHVELLQEVKSNDIKHKDELKNLFVKELSGFTEENKKLQKNTNVIQQQVQLEQEALSKLRDTVQNFYDQVDKINFPKRLKDIDSGVSSNLNAIHSVQGRFDLIESNLSEKLKDLKIKETETRNILENEIKNLKKEILNTIELANKRQRIFSFITWTITALSFLFIFFIKFKR
jgi:chromosome segregation ATPase